MKKTEIEALFAKMVRNEGNDRAEVRDTLFNMSSSDRVKLLTSVEFVDIAVRNAAALGITNDPSDMDEDMDEDMDDEEGSTKTGAYNHAYDFAFEVVSSDPEAEDVTPTMIRAALLERVNRLSDDDLMHACSCYDTYEMEE